METNIQNEHNVNQALRKCLITGQIPQEASQEELLFIRHHAPKHFIGIISERTGKTKSAINYQIMQMPDNQDLIIIQAAREILYVVKGLVYKKKNKP